MSAGRIRALVRDSSKCVFAVLHQAGGGRILTLLK